MKYLEVTLKGISPLLMNSNVGVNPTLELVKELKKLTSKRKKTDEDNIKILDIKWQLAIYFDEDVGGPYVPAINIEATIRDAAKKVRKGKDIVASLVVSPDFIPLIYDGPHDLAGLKEDPRFRDVRVGVIKGSSILLCRPRFNSWQLKFTIMYDEGVFNKDELAEILQIAGAQIGLCDYRPRYGRFVVVSVEQARGTG